MHLLLTDRLLCPRCGPGFGLILLAREIRDRRVLEGTLGCSNCRDQYPIREGVGDLREAPRSTLDLPSEADGPRPEVEGPAALRLAALLGVTEGPGTLLLEGASARHAKGVADLIGKVEVVAMSREVTGREEEEGVSRLVAGSRYPFFSGSFRGVALGRADAARDLAEAVRVAAPGGRVVVLEAGHVGGPDLRELGLTVVLEEDGVLVGEVPSSGGSPLVTLRGP